MAKGEKKIQRMISDYVPLNVNTKVIKNLKKV
jgi:hypothetical protein